MAWGKAGSTTLSSAGDNITVSDMTASENNAIMLHKINSGNVNPLLTFNSDSGSNYAWRYSSNGGTDSTVTNGTKLEMAVTGITPTLFTIFYVNNISAEEKLVIGNTVEQNTAGAGTAPQRMEVVGKWTNTSSQITALNFGNDATGDYAIDSNASVLGSDLTPAAAVPALGANVQAGSRYEETDTRKMYNLSALSFDFSATSTGAVSNQPTDATEVGQLITSTTHQGKKAKSATFYVQRVGSPGGTMVYKIRKSSDNSVVATSTGTSASALSTSKTAVTLNFNDEDIPSENIRVTVSGVTGSSGNLVTIYGGGADTVADQSLSVWGGSSWTEYGNDCAGELTFTEEWQEIGA